MYASNRSALYGRFAVVRCHFFPGDNSIAICSAGNRSRLKHVRSFTGIGDKQSQRGDRKCETACDLANWEV